MEHNNEFEQEVRRALARIEAPEGFSGRVMERARQRQARPFARFAAPAWRGAYAAAAMLALVAGSMHVHHVREAERRAAEAQQQFAKAMDITDHALDRVAAQLQRGPVGQITNVLESER